MTTVVEQRRNMVTLRCRHTWHSLEYIFGFLLMTTWVNPILLILSLAANEQTLPGGAGAPYSSGSSSGKQDAHHHLPRVDARLPSPMAPQLLRDLDMQNPAAVSNLPPLPCRAAKEESKPGAGGQPCGVAQTEEGRCAARC
jgi:hypothetical protein